MADMKRAYAEALCALLEEKPLDKIRVKDITSRLGVSRQSFYYHFDSIHEVLAWIYAGAAENFLNQFGSMENWPYAYLLVLKWMQERKKLVMNTYHSLEREYVEFFMQGVLSRYTRPIAAAQAAGMRVSEGQSCFVADFYTRAVVAATLEWVRTEMRETPEELVRKVCTLLKGSFAHALANFARESNNGFDKKEKV